jgi:hypothetical protein
MYGENVTIIINGKEIELFVFCFPNMPKEKLKELAIEKYIRELKIRLYEENNLEIQ